MPISEVYNVDCLEYVRSLPDKYFDLCIADPPYGINFGNFNRTNKDSAGNRFKSNKYHNADWDLKTPDEELFRELFRISENQIIWGGNYFNLPPTKGFIFWYKHQPVSNFSDGEFAWTSFQKVARCFDYPYYGNINADKIRIHPTQKPVALYSWLLDNYANRGGRIFDPFLGSGSSRIAAYKKGFDFYACELDKEYFEAQEERFRKECHNEEKLSNGIIITQQSLF